jgi:hypothetical protein
MNLADTRGRHQLDPVHTRSVVDPLHPLVRTRTVWATQYSLSNRTN